MTSQSQAVGRNPVFSGIYLPSHRVRPRNRKLITSYSLQLWYQTNLDDTECCSSVQALRGCRLTVFWTKRSRIQHFTCDITVTSFYMGVKPNFHTTSTIYAGRYAYAKFRASSFSRCEDIARKKTCKNMPPSGWRVAQRPSGRRVNTKVIIQGLIPCTFNRKAKCDVATCEPVHGHCCRRRSDRCCRHLSVGGRGRCGSAENAPSVDRCLWQRHVAPGRQTRRPPAALRPRPPPPAVRRVPPDSPNTAASLHWLMV